MQTLAKTIFVIGIVTCTWLILLLFVKIIYNPSSVIQEQHSGFYYGANKDICLYGCPSEIYNECYGEEGEALQRCISDKEYEQKVLKNYK